MEKNVLIAVTPGQTVQLYVQLCFVCKSTPMTLRFYCSG